MAIDRKKIYFEEWVVALTNWKMRLEIRPAGGLMNDDTYTYKRMESVVMSVGTVKQGFSDIVVGMMYAPSVTIDMEFGYFDDANFDELIRNQFYTFNDTVAGAMRSITTTNLFVLLSDCGSGGDIDKVIYVGAQSNQIGNKFKYNAATGKLTSAKIETFDLMKVIFDTTPTRWLCDYILDEYAATYTVADSFSYYDFIRSASEFKYDSLDKTAELWQVNKVFTDYLAAFLSQIQGYWTRNWRPYSPIEFVGPEVDVTGSPFDHITFYKQTVTTAHTRGFSLTSDDLLIVGRVGGSGDPIGGMLIEDKGSETLQEHQYLTDLIRTVAEGLFCKFIYTPTHYDHDELGLVLNYQIKWLAVYDYIDAGLDLTDTFNQQFDEAEIETGYNTLNIAEAELPNMSSPNLSTVEVRKSAADGAPTWNYRTVFHNLPTFPAAETLNVSLPYQVKERRLNLRKLLYRDTSLGSGVAQDFDYAKVHESCVIGTGVFVGGSDTPTAVPTLIGGGGVFLYNSAKAWAIATQRTNNIAVAINSLVLNLYSNESILNITGTFTLDTLPYFCVGELVNIPVPDMFFDYEQGYVILETEADYKRDGGTVKCSFITIAGE